MYTVGSKGGVWAVLEKRVFCLFPRDWGLGDVASRVLGPRVFGVKETTRFFGTLASYL